MAGRPDFSTPGSQGSGQTIAVTQRPEIKEVNADQTTNVSASANEKTEIYAPAGSIYEVQAMRLKAPGIGAATTGFHLFDVFSISVAYGILSGRNGYGSQVWWKYSKWYRSDGTNDLPSDEVAQGNQVTKLKATENSPIVVNYQNETDATQSNQRDIRLVVKEDSY